MREYQGITEKAPQKKCPTSQDLQPEQKRDKGKSWTKGT